MRRTISTAKTHALAGIAAPRVAALIGARGGEFVDQIAFRAHHLDAVVAGLACQPRGACIGDDLPVHGAGRQGAWGKRGDRCLELGRRHRQRVVGIAPGMQQLQADLGPVFVDGAGDLAMWAHFPRPGQLATEWLEPTHHVRREPAGDDQAHAAGSALGEIRRQLGEIARTIFQACVHRAHQNAVAELGEAQVERGEQVREG